MALLASICPCPVSCGETVMESWQIVCVLERVVFFAHTFFFFKPCLPCIITLSLFLTLAASLLLPPPSSPRPFSDRHLTTCEERNYGNTELVISEHDSCEDDTAKSGLFLLLSLCGSPSPPSVTVSMSLCASQTCLISRFDQNNWQWPCCQRASCCIQIGRRNA